MAPGPQRPGQIDLPQMTPVYCVAIDISGNYVATMVSVLAPMRGMCVWKGGRVDGRHVLLVRFECPGWWGAASVRDPGLRSEPLPRTHFDPGTDAHVARPRAGVMHAMPSRLGRSGGYSLASNVTSALIPARMPGGCTSRSMMVL